MKKLPLSLAVIILAALTAHAQKDASHDFRNTRWGMSPAQVKLTENGKPVSETELPPYELAISYKGKYEGLDAEITHAGTAERDGAIVTAGGRVLNVTALGPDREAARRAAYAAADVITFDGKTYRRDIAA